MIVVLDTNIWKSQIYLQSPIATATRFFLRQKKARLGLPEVIRREVETHFKRDVLELISELKGGHLRLFDIVRNLRELVLPDEAEVDKIVAQIFDNVGVEILPVPFSFTSAEASFQKIINEVAPSETKEQFKDGVIWADCLELLKTDDVFLITKDKAFYKDRDYKQGLARSLAAELSEARHKLTLLSELTDLFSEIKEKISVDDTLLAHDFWVNQKESIIDLPSKHGFEVGEGTVVQHKLFATENPRLLFVQFKIEYECPDQNLARGSAVLKVEGECRYNTDTKTFDQFVIQDQELRFNTPAGIQTKQHYIFAAAHLSVGHKNITKIVRVELE